MRGPRAEPPPRPAAPAGEDSIDLGATVLPVLLKTYWKQGLVALLVVAVIVWAARR